MIRIVESSGAAVISWRDLSDYHCDGDFLNNGSGFPTVLIITITAITPTLFFPFPFPQVLLEPTLYHFSLG